ncbi:hypothetical protein [Sinorhizobium meliloti]|uniref:hypothetical protein n=1 Tax=Rhizobium meliloti TaxID=382 RepID=UPI00037B6C4F|nr:hypothetical protein [Sinorhizobium meliloti]
MISDLLHCALVAISSNRSQGSWVAGSSVVAKFIGREPNDIDIHHVSIGAYEEAVDKDISSLVEVGFSSVARRQTNTELDVTFSNAGSTLSMNWVLESTPPVAIIEDPLLGMRASFADVIARKIEMYTKDPQSKHRDDLLALLRRSTELARELDPTKFTNDLRKIGIIE